MATRMLQNVILIWINNTRYDGLVDVTHRLGEPRKLVLLFVFLMYFILWVLDGFLLCSLDGSSWTLGVFNSCPDDNDGENCRIMSPKKDGLFDVYEMLDRWKQIKR